MTDPARAEAGAWRYPGDVRVSADDIAWFRRLRSLWVESESGAPALFGPGMSPDTIMTMSQADYDAYVARLEPILCAVFLHAQFDPGAYGFAQPLDGQAGIEVTADDIKLLRITQWRGFAMDGKRPYGDYTNYVIDMARALGLPVTRSAQGYDEISPEADARLVALHRRMQFVVQAYLEHSQLAPGDWFIPFDGWELPVQPRCRPVGRAAVATYRSDMERIRRRAASDLVPSRFQALAPLFGPD